MLEAAQAEYWGGHPLGRSILGTPLTVSALDAEQLRAQLQRTYAPSRVLLVVTGAFQEAEVWAWAEQALGDWPHNHGGAAADPVPGAAPCRPRARAR